MPGQVPTELNPLLIDTAIVFASGLVFALLARLLRQGPLLGYLVAGIVIGPFFLGLVHNEANIRLLADVGVVFLMFALGVQLSLRELLEVRTSAFSIAAIELLAMIGLGMLIGRLVGLPPAAGLIIGYTLALSSSVVLVRLLSDHEEAQTTFGRLAIGISLVQDLAAVVLISTLPFFREEASGSYLSLFLSLFRSILFVLLALLLARMAIPRILRWVSATGSREIFLLAVVALSMAGAIISLYAGFSFALGAFLAGLVVSGPVFSHAVLAEIMPLRDLFGLLFFVSLGMLVNPAILLGSWGLALVLLLAAVIGKGLILFLAVLLLRHHPYTAAMIAAGMAQIGEFSFVIARESRAAAIIPSSLDVAILSVATISIALTPLLLSGVIWWYETIRKRGTVPVDVDDYIEILTDEKVPVLLCGYGRVGHTIAQALDTFRIPFIVIDINRGAVEMLQARDIHAVYGDAANLRLLERIGAATFRLAIIAVPGTATVRMIVSHLRRLNPDIRLVTRSHSTVETSDLFALGAEVVFHIEMEASLAFVREVLTTAEVDDEIVDAYLEDIRLGYYEGLMPPRKE